MAVIEMEKAPEKAFTASVEPTSSESDDSGHGEHGNVLTQTFGTSANKDLQRLLSNRQIQLFAIGGTIGGAIFLALGGALAQGGPGSLFLGYAIHIIFQGMVTNCAAEMTSFMPVAAAFIQHATKWVDPAWGFMVGWNYYIYIATGIPFELVSTSLILGYWRDDIPVAAVICVLIVIYM